MSLVRCCEFSYRYAIQDFENLFKFNGFALGDVLCNIFFCFNDSPCVFATGSWLDFDSSSASSSVFADLEPFRDVSFFKKLVFSAGSCVSASSSMAALWRRLDFENSFVKSLAFDDVVEILNGGGNA